MAKKDFSKSTEKPVKTLSFGDDNSQAPIQNKSSKARKEAGEYNNIKLIIYMPETLARDFKRVVEKLNADELAPAKLSDFGRRAIQEFVNNYK